MEKSLELYRANIVLCQRMYAVLSVFEVILRNSVDRHFVSIMGPEWLVESVSQNGMFDGPGCEETYHSVQEAIHRLNINYTPDSLLSSLSFGFWTYQFSPKVFAASGNSLLKIFLKRPFGTKQKDIFQLLFKINEIRNRIAHHEPICFYKKTGKISVDYVSKRYNIIVDVLSMLGCNPEKILANIDNVQLSITEINAMGAVHTG